MGAELLADAPAAPDAAGAGAPAPVPVLALLAEAIARARACVCVCVCVCVRVTTSDAESVFASRTRARALRRLFVSYESARPYHSCSAVRQSARTKCRLERMIMCEQLILRNLSTLNETRLRTLC